MSSGRLIRGFGLIVLGLVSRSLAAEDGAACRPDFIAAQSYSAPSSVIALATADMDGDGRPDLVVTSNNYSSVLSVRLGQPDGSLGPPINKATSTNPYGSAVGLFTNDSVPDVVLAGFALLLFQGNGDGTFQDPVAIDPGSYSWIQSADVDGDGKPDLVTQGYYDSTIEVFIGNGDGTFQPPILTSPVAIFGFALGDLNADGRADIVGPTGGAAVEVFLSNGDGTFAPPSDVIVGGVSVVTLADVTTDGVLDILAIVNGRVGVLVGNGDGTFQTALLYDAGPAPTQILSGDLDGDGLPDLAVSSSPTASVWLLRGLGTGAFLPAGAYATDFGPHSIVAADFGLDGALDLVTGSDSSARVTLLRGEGNGSFRSARISGGFEYGQLVAQGDFNHDDKPDLAVAEYYGDLQILLGNGDSTFSPGAEYQLNLYNPSGIVSADFNADAHLDLAILTTYSPQVVVVLGNGDGHFGAPNLVDVGSGASYFNFLAAGNFAGGPQADLAIVDQQNAPGADIVILPSQGDGTFGSPIITPIGQSSVYGLASDLDGNGFSDLVLPNGPSNLYVEVFLAVGDGTFQAPASYPFGAVARNPIAAHLHDGGPLDLVIPSDSQPILEILTGNGDGTFGVPIALGLGAPAYSVASADFNEDGHVDLVLANQTGDASVLLGLGNGSFLSPTLFSIGPAAGSVFTGDYDDNGRIDAAFVSGAFSSTVSVLRNGALSARAHDASAIVGSSAEVSVSAGGFGPLTFQWRKEGVPLSDGGPISGATTATLTIDPVAFTDAGSYDVVVTDSCGSANSNAATLSVEFDDVPLSNPFHDDIIAIATAGITTGCNTGTSYCPSASVSRAEMAVFLLKAKFGSGHVPPPPPPVPIFADVPASAFAAAWIDELATLGITGGCGNGNYCPDDPVTRGQMAVFLLKTLLGSGYVPPTATGIFADVPPGYFAIDWIEDLYARGITAGCGTGPLRYCPDQAVPREQMAAFLVRTFLGP